MKTLRIYQGRDVDMLTAISAIIENAIANQEFLISKRPSWEGTFESYKNRIENAFNNHLGIDGSTEQHKASSLVTQIQNVATNDLSDFKVQVQEDFKSDKAYCDDILNNLGYTGYYRQVIAKDQEAIVQLLYRFKTNLTKELRAEITKKGTDIELINRICTYADQLAEANITPEMLKGIRKNLTEEGLIELNAIYNDVISIAKIARNFYKGRPYKQDEFSYTKIRKKLNGTPSKKIDDFLD